MSSRRWDGDDRGRGVAHARSAVPALDELSALAKTDGWIAEEPEKHLLPGIQDRVAISGLSLDESIVHDDGSFFVRLSSSVRLSRREIRQSVWSILGGVAELTTHVHESHEDGVARFDVVTGMPATGGEFATHGHTLRIEVVQPA